jgi:hypothetical protein
MRKNVESVGAMMADFVGENCIPFRRAHFSLICRRIIRSAADVAWRLASSANTRWFVRMECRETRGPTERAQRRSSIK